LKSLGKNACPNPILGKNQPKSAILTFGNVVTLFKKEICVKRIARELAGSAFAICCVQTAGNDLMPGSAGTGARVRNR
jgi:hypothetical protein